MSYVPITPTHQQPIFRGSSVNDLKSPGILIKNTSQPYIIQQQNPVISPMIIEGRPNEIHYHNNMPFSPRSMPLGMNQIKM